MQPGNPDRALEVSSAALAKNADINIIYGVPNRPFVRQKLLVFALVGSGLAGELSGFSVHDVSAISWAGLSYLIWAGSVIGFTAYMWLLDHAPGPLVATYTFVNPIVAVILGWRFLGERPTPQMLVGTVLVVGSVVAVWRLNNRSPRQAR